MFLLVLSAMKISKWFARGRGRVENLTGREVESRGDWRVGHTDADAAGDPLERYCCVSLRHACVAVILIAQEEVSKLMDKAVTTSRCRWWPHVHTQSRLTSGVGGWF